MTLGFLETKSPFEDVKLEENDFFFASRDVVVELLTAAVCLESN